MLTLKIKLSIISLFILALQQNASAQEQILDVTVIHIPPEVIIDPETRGVTGSVAEAARAMARKCRASINFVVTPAWSRAFRLAVDGTVDAVVPTIESAERSKFLFFPKHPVIKSEMGLIAMKSDGHKGFTGFAMLDNKRIGRIAGGLIAPEFDTYLHENEITVSRQHSYFSLFKSLVARRVDFVVGNQASYLHFANELGITDEIQLLTPVIHSVPQYLALSRAALANHPERNTLYECLFTVTLN